MTIRDEFTEEVTGLTCTSGRREGQLGVNFGTAKVVDALATAASADAALVAHEVPVANAVGAAWPGAVEVAESAVDSACFVAVDAGTWFPVPTGLEAAEDRLPERLRAASALTEPGYPQERSGRGLVRRAVILLLLAFAGSQRERGRWVGCENPERGLQNWT